MLVLHSSSVTFFQKIQKYFHTHHGCRGTFNIKEGKLEDLPFSYCNMTLSQNVHFIVEVHCVELRRPELHTGVPQIHCSEIRHSAFSISVEVKEFIELPFWNWPLICYHHIPLPDIALSGRNVCFWILILIYHIKTNVLKEQSAHLSNGILSVHLSRLKCTFVCPLIWSLNTKV